MWFVKLVDVTMRANHGLYQQETLLGNDFTINISVGFEQGFIKHLHESIDYVLLYNIAKKHMDVPTQLLEEVVSNICIDVEQQVTACKYLYISIQKKNPAFANQISASEVVLEKSYV